jgi:hypothetical protein
MVALHLLWPLGEQSFRVLTETRLWRRAPAGVVPLDSDDAMLGDSWDREASHVSTHGIAIARSATLVWPWLAQMMRGAGIQGWPKLETARCRSADYLVAGLGAPRVGERLCDVLGIVAVNPGHEIVWQSLATLDVTGVPVERLTLDYRVDAIASGTCQMRVRLRASLGEHTPSMASHLVALIDAILPLHQLARIKGCSEATSASGISAHAARAAHQRANLSGARRGSDRLKPP